MFSSTPKEHLERLRHVFQRFRAHNLKINPDKCDFFRRKVQFLGQMVSKDCLEVDPSKIEAVQKFPVPRSQTEVKSFLGLSSYFRRFVPKFAEIERPLHKASQTSTNFEWTREAQDAFDSLKLKLTSTSILAFPCLKEPFIFYTDASQIVMGAVQRIPYRFKNPEAVTSRWFEKLAPFDYEVRHQPGKSIGHADGLSYIPLNSIKVIETDLPSTAPQNEIPKVADVISNYEEVISNVFDSKDSFAHCVSADFKMSAGIARLFERKFPTNYPTDLDHSYTPLWPQ